MFILIIFILTTHMDGVETSVVKTTHIDKEACENAATTVRKKFSFITSSYSNKVGVMATAICISKK